MEMNSQKDLRDFPVKMTDFMDSPVEVVITHDPYRSYRFPVPFEDLWIWILPHLDQDRIERVLTLDSMKKENVIPRMQFLVQAHDIVGEHIMKRAVEDMRAWMDSRDGSVERVIVHNPYQDIRFPVRFEDLWIWILPHLDQDKIERVLTLNSMKNNVISRREFLLQAHNIVGEHIMKRAVEDMRAAENMQAGASSSR